MSARIGMSAGGKVTFLRVEKQLRSAVVVAVKSGLVSGVKADGNYLAAEPEQFHLALDRARKRDVCPLLVLDGPAPLSARRVPSSLVILPLNDLVQVEEFGLSELAAMIVEKLRSEIAVSKGEGGQVFAGELSQLSLTDVGEPQSPSAGVLAFATLWEGRENASGPEHFWAHFRHQCEEKNLSPEAMCRLVLNRYCVWFSPYTSIPIHPEEASAIYDIVRGNWQKNDQASHCFGAQYWNHPAINATFSGKKGSVRFHDTQESAVSGAEKDGGQILSWAGRTDHAFEETCKARKIPLVRIEDGFLRSVGLGAGLARGAMLAVDDLGIYYDPSRPSRLEVLLNDYDFTDAERERGKSLTELIRTARVSKYNFGRSKEFSFPPGKLKILVPGQVADDAAIRKSRSNTIDCANTANVNYDLLKLARARNPDAFLVFKPHPDVETGLRKGKLDRSTALEYADVVAEDSNIISLIEAVDVVETFSSLSGFEALLRGKQVVVHGAPFYAGWGLTEDLTEIETRKRRRTLSELVFLALVKYARTIDPVSLVPCTPEFLVSRLVEQRSDKKHLFVTAIKRHSSWLGRKLGI